METTNGFLIAVGWFLLRFGIPVLITLLVGMLLKRIDARWQVEGEEYRKQSGLDDLIPMINCWVFNNCSEEKRKNCKAYQEPKKPCWQHFRAQNGEIKENCLGCGVFRGTPVSMPGD